MFQIHAIIQLQKPRLPAGSARTGLAASANVTCEEPEDQCGCARSTKWMARLPAHFSEDVARRRFALSPATEGITAGRVKMGRCRTPHDERLAPRAPGAGRPFEPHRASYRMTRQAGDRQARTFPGWLPPSTGDGFPSRYGSRTPTPVRRCWNRRVAARCGNDQFISGSIPSS